MRRSDLLDAKITADLIARKFLFNHDAISVRDRTRQAPSAIIVSKSRSTPKRGWRYLIGYRARRAANAQGHRVVGTREIYAFGIG